MSASSSFPATTPVLRTLAWELPQHIGERVLLQGWLHHQRHLKAVDFLLLRDRSGIAQVVIEEPDLRAQLAALPHETVLDVQGYAAASPQAPNGVELHDPELTVLSEGTGEPPIELFRPEMQALLATRLDHAAISLRHPVRAMTQRLLAAAMHGFRQSLMAEGFTEISTPKLLEAAPEGGANVFSVDYFGRPAYLAQSPQLYKQMMVGALERVFEVGPVFRAEPHDTSRHVSQFLSLDAEMGFIRDHQDLMQVVRDVLAGMMVAMAAVDGPVSVPIPDVPKEIPQIHFREALTLLGKALGQDLRDEPDLAPEHERWLGEWADREHHSQWLFVTGYPTRKRPFYTHPQPDDPRWSNSFDLLFRGLEIMTGGQRLSHHADYLAALGERRIDPEPFRGYLEAFRHGMPPHGGFALGVERMIRQITGAQNVRDVMLFPRDMSRLAP
ncbi:MAG TPA: aspartate--tRNA(Asn) ligase [Thermomicrobiales bacterium]|nr:aspartate--tRNA(Asn) ligase [Thermomicrobiales bacterium]